MLELQDWSREVLAIVTDTPVLLKIVLLRRRGPAKKQNCPEDSNSCLENAFVWKTDTEISCRCRSMESSTTTTFEPISGRTCQSDENFLVELTPLGYFKNPSSKNFGLKAQIHVEAGIFFLRI